MDKRISAGIAGGGVPGILVFVLINEEILLPKSLSPHVWALVALLVLPGILTVYVGRNIINSTHDLIVSIAAGSITFSLIFVFSTIFFDITSGIISFGGLDHILGAIWFFILLFFSSFLLSIGAGSFFAGYVLQKPIPDKEQIGKST